MLNTGDALSYFVETTAVYCNISTSLEIDFNLVSSDFKILSGDGITITKKE